MDSAGADRSDFFLWTVIDRLCADGNRLIAPGFESEGRYVLTLRLMSPNDCAYRKEVTDTAQRDNLLRIADLIRRCPEVADLTIVRPYSFPNCMSWSGNTLTTDTLDNAQTRKLSAQYYEFMPAKAATCSAPTACARQLPDGTSRFRKTV